METTTSGVSSDLRRVASVATNMVRQWGMGSFAMNTDRAFAAFLDWDMNKHEYNTSSETSREIEVEVKKIVDDCLENVRGLLREKRKELDLIARGLIEKETLFYKDLVHILEPGKSDADIDKEIATLTERKLVGKPPVINLEYLPGLAGLSGGGGNGGNGDKGSGDSSNSAIQPNQKMDDLPQNEA
jgi:hypothetical protein